ALTYKAISSPGYLYEIWGILVHVAYYRMCGYVYIAIAGEISPIAKKELIEDNEYSKDTIRITHYEYSFYSTSFKMKMFYLITNISSEILKCVLYKDKIDLMSVDMDP
ncbi:hypothetical protein L9F63_008308, partial [Diploptera punctata]